MPASDLSLLARPEDAKRGPRTLQQVRGNKAVAARLLGISRRAFYRQLERHGLHRRIPMTSRVEVNRMWHEFFGRGVVRTS